METGRSDWAQNKNAFCLALFYEFCGSALISYAFNLSSSNLLIRAIAYAVGYVIAYNVSGAHFNPATTLAVMLTRKNMEIDLKYFIVAFFVQLSGCYAGVLISYLQAKDFTDYYELYPANQDLYFYDGNYMWFGRIILQEVLQTFTFTLIFLMLRFDQEYSKVNRTLKAIALFHVLLVLYFISAQSGGCFNPALGMSQTTYMVALNNNEDTDRRGNAQAIWVYMVFPFVGAAIASVVFGLLQNAERKIK